MQAQGNKAVVRRFWEEVVNQRNLDVADEIFASDHMFNVAAASEEEWPPSRVKDYVALYGKLYPDMQVTVEDEIAEGDKVVCLWTIRGTLADELRTITSDADEMVESVLHIYHVSDGKIRKSWWRFDATADESQTPREEVVEFLLKDASEDPLTQRIGGLIVSGDEDELKPCCWIPGCCKPRP